MNTVNYLALNHLGFERKGVQGFDELKNEVIELKESINEFK